MTITEIKNLVKTALKPLNVPFHYQTKMGEGDPYFTYFILSDSYAGYGDGEPLIGQATIQLDGWSKGDLDDLVYKARKAMENEGFRYQQGRDFYERDTETYHRMEQFVIFKEEQYGN